MASVLRTIPQFTTAQELASSFGIPDFITPEALLSIGAARNPPVDRKAIRDAAGWSEASLSAFLNASSPPSLENLIRFMQAVADTFGVGDPKLPGCAAWGVVVKRLQRLHKETVRWTDTIPSWVDTIAGRSLGMSMAAVGAIADPEGYGTYVLDSQGMAQYTMTEEEVACYKASNQEVRDYETLGEPEKLTPAMLDLIKGRYERFRLGPNA